MINIGFISRPHGIHGEVKITPITHIDEIFIKMHDIYVSTDIGCGQRMEVERIRRNGNRYIAKFRGIEERSQAVNLCNAVIQIPRGDAYSYMEEFGVDYSLCKGFTVCDENGGIIGKLEEVMRSPGQDILVVVSSKKEFLIPAVPYFIKQLEIKYEKIIIHVIEGLIDFPEN